MSPILGSIGGASEYSFRGNLDNIPNAIIFENLTDVEPGAVGVATTTVTGINYKALVTVSGGAETSVDGGSYSTSNKSIRNGQTLSVKFTTTSGSDSDFSKNYNADITVGRNETVWSVTTRAKDTTPTSFSFTSSTNQTVGIATTSNVIEILAIEPGIPTFAFISSGIGSFSVNAVSGFTTAQVSVGDTISIQTKAPNTYSTSKVVGFTVGTFTTTFTVSTLDADKTVNSFTFSPVTDANINQDQSSNIITLSGATNNVALAATVSGSSGSVSINSGSFLTGTVNVFNGNTIRLKIPASAISEYDTTYQTTLNVLGIAGTFSVTTRSRPVDTIPSQFTFTDVTSAAPETYIESNIITLSGMTSGDTGTATISGSSAEFKVTRSNVVVRSYSSSSYSVRNGDQIQLRILSAKELGTTQATFTVSGTDTTTLPGTTGSTADIWSVKSRDLICSGLVASNFFRSGFSNIESAELNRQYSTSIDFTGYDSKCNFRISTSNTNSYLENPYTGEIGSNISVPTLPSTGIKVYLISSTNYNTVTSTTLSIFNEKNPSEILTKEWVIVTKQVDSVPDDFSIPWVSGATPGDLVTSEVSNVTGLSENVSVTASISSLDSGGGGSFEISKNNEPFSTEIQVQNGDIVAVRGIAPGLNQSINARIKIGIKEYFWRITSKKDQPSLTVTALKPNRQAFPVTVTSLYDPNLPASVAKDKLIRLNENIPYNQTIILSYLSSSTLNGFGRYFRLKLPYYIIPTVLNNTVNLFDARYWFYTTDSPAGLPTYKNGDEFFRLRGDAYYRFPYGTIDAEYKYSGGLQPTNPITGTTDVEFRFELYDPEASPVGYTTVSIVGTIAPPPPTVTITASPTGTINYGGSYTLTWNSTYATSVSSSTDLNNTTSTSGSFTVLNARETKTHSITVANETGTTTASVTVSVNPCVPTTISTDSAIYTKGRLISTGRSEIRDEFLTTIKDNDFTNRILEYPSRTSEYSSHKLKTVIYTIASFYQRITQRPPTRTEVDRWLGEYQRGISAPYTFNFEITKYTEIPCQILFYISNPNGTTTLVTVPEVTDSLVNGQFKKSVAVKGLIAGAEYTVRYSAPSTESQYDNLRKYVTTNQPAMSVINPGRYGTAVYTSPGYYLSPSIVSGDTLGGEYYEFPTSTIPTYWDYMITLSSVTEDNGFRQSYGSSFTANSFAGSATFNASFTFRLSSLTALVSQMIISVPTFNSYTLLEDECGNRIGAVSDPGS